MSHLQSSIDHSHTVRKWVLRLSASPQKKKSNQLPHPRWSDTLSQSSRKLWGAFRQLTECHLKEQRVFNLSVSTQISYCFSYTLKAVYTHFVKMLLMVEFTDIQHIYSDLLQLYFMYHSLRRNNLSNVSQVYIHIQCNNVKSTVSYQTVWFSGLITGSQRLHQNG